MVTIFIVEDDPNVQKIYEKMLRHSSFHIIGMANNGKEAIKMYQSFSKKPDIILMDHHMPVKKGLEAATEILRINSESKIVIVSADNNVKDKALSLGVKKFLTKPFGWKSLIQIIKDVL